MDEAEMEADFEENDSHTDYWKKRQYEKCRRIITQRGFNLRNTSADLKDWIIRFNGLSCDLKLARTRDEIIRLQSKLTAFSDELSGVSQSFATLCLDAFIVHNLLSSLYQEELNSVSSQLIRTENVTHILAQFLCRFSEFLGCIASDCQPINITDCCVEILEKIQTRGESVLYLVSLFMIFDCVVYYLMKGEPHSAHELLVAFKTCLPDHSIFLPCTLKPSALDIEVILNDSNQSESVSHLSQSYDQLDVIHNLFLHVYVLTNDFVSFMEQIQDGGGTSTSADHHYTQAFILFKQNRLEECVTKCSQVKDTVAEDDQSRWYNLLACCIYKEGRHHTALQLFTQSTQKSTTNLLPLYNMSICYGTIGLFTAEIECFELIIKTLQNSKIRIESVHNLICCGALLLKDNSMYRGIYLPHALYFNAKRCLELKKFKCAVNNYSTLIKYIKNGNGIEDWQSYSTGVNIPLITTLYRELIYSQLSSNHYADAKKSCDHLSKAFQGMYVITENQESDRSLTQTLAQSKDMTRKRQAVYESSTDQSLLDECICLMFQADAASHLCEYNNALSSVNKVIEICYQNLMFRSDNDDDDKNVKICKTDDSEIVNAPQQVQASQEPSVSGLLKDAYMNKANILIALKQYQTAIHVSKLAVQLQPHCMTALYNHTLILLSNNRWKDACHAWLPTRDVTPTPATLHATLTHVQARVRELEANAVEQEDAHLNELSELEMVRLDAHLLESLRDHTRIS